MAISLSVFLALYGISVIVFLVFSFFLLYHALRFGQVSILNLFTLLTYSAGALALVYFAARFIDAHDWTQTIDVFSSLSTLFY